LVHVALVVVGAAPVVVGDGQIFLGEFLGLNSLREELDGQDQIAPLGRFVAGKDVAGRVGRGRPGRGGWRRGQGVKTEREGDYCQTRLRFDSLPFSTAVAVT
jgi:hypothetical protein